MNEVFLFSPWDYPYIQMETRIWVKTKSDGKRKIFASFICLHCAECSRVLRWTPQMLSL